MSAINRLKRDTRRSQILNDAPINDEFFEIEIAANQTLKLIHIYDVPHLMKCIRNNLMTKDLLFTIDGIQKHAKWSHFQELYTEDGLIPNSKMLPRLTDQHIIPEKVKKMKVKYATQVFSQRVSSTMTFLACKYIHVIFLFLYNNNC